MESILQGFLTKSPPEKKQFKLFGSKWRKRYFVLYAPPTVDGIPDAYTAILEYYTSKKLSHKCGTINLADCEELLSSLDSDIYKYVFGLRTMHKHQLRTYYLAADTEVEMNKWVGKLCQVLGLTENDDNLGSPPSQTQSRAQPMKIPCGSTKQPFSKSLTHHTPMSPSIHPAPPPPRPSLPNAPFTRLNISEPNLLDVTSPKIDGRRETFDVGWQMALPPGTSKLASPPASTRIRNAESFPELDRFSPTLRKPGAIPGEGREFMELPPIPPEKTGAKVVAEPDVGVDYDLPKQKYYERENTDVRNTNIAYNNDFYNMPPGNRYKPSTGNDFGQEKLVHNGGGGWYNVPPTSQAADECYNIPKPSDQWPASQTDGRRDENSNAHSEEFYNVPKSQLDKRKHASQGHEDFYNVPKAQTNQRDDPSYLPEKKSDRRSYGGQSRSNEGQFGHVSRYDAEDEYDIPRSKPVNHDPQEDYDVPKSKSPERFLHDVTKPKGLGNAWQDDYDIPQSKALSHDYQEEYDMPKSSYLPRHGIDIAVRDSQMASSDRPKCFWEMRSNMGAIGEKQPAQPESKPVTSSAGFHGNPTGKSFENIPHSVPSASSSISPSSTDFAPPKPTRSPLLPSADQQTKAEDATLNSLKDQGPPAVHVKSLSEMEGFGATELKKTPSGAFKQNKSAVQSSSSLQRKQQMAAGLPIHDSIRFTQRTKSFKRSIPSQDRSTLPLPVKRIVERSESSSSSTSDEESADHNSSSPPKEKHT